MTSKVHIAVDGLGNPLRFILTGGQVGDVTQAEELIADVAGANLIADTAYDADHLRARLNDAGIVAVIPSNPSRAQAIPYDAELYKERHLVECYINKIKHFRRIATRYEKTATAYMAMLFLVGASSVSDNCQQDLEDATATAKEKATAGRLMTWLTELAAGSTRCWTWNLSPSHCLSRPWSYATRRWS